MVNSLFLACLCLTFAFLFWWAFHVLPREDWQILATLPLEKGNGRTWTGLNLTYYGFFTACAVTFAVAIFFILMGSLDTSNLMVLQFAILILGFTGPSAKIIARIVEKKSFTFTIGGASFVCMIIAPWLIMLINVMNEDEPFLPMIPTVAALCIAYAMGEGIGRLACISYGCCYGKPLSSCRPVFQRLFTRFHFQFTGKTKKTAYEAGLESVPLFPIQAVTAALYVSAGLVGTSLFLAGRFNLAIWVTLLVTQLWRVISEWLRADYRGVGKFSMYQVMALCGAVYLLAMSSLWPNLRLNTPFISNGLKTLFNTHHILTLQILWLSIFVFTGRSQVTGATLSFFVRKERI